MYYPENILEMGINAPKEHQRVISKLTTGLGYLFYMEHSIALEPLPETQIDEGQSSPVPDILLYDNEEQQTRIIIEICHPTGFNNDMRKVIRLIDENDYGVIEGFIYDYVRKQWRKYQKGAGEITVNPSFSHLLNLDLAALL